MPGSSRKKKYDYTLLAALSLLLLAGLVILQSTSAWNGEVKFNDPYYYLKKQVFATTIGIAAMFVTANMDYHVLRRFALPAYLAAVLLSVAVLLVGDEYNGSRRWLSLGPFSFQPSEFAKVAVILFLADLVTKCADKVKKMDRDRKLYYEARTGREWGGIEANAMMFNTSLLGIDGVVDALEAIYHKWEER